MDSLTVFKSDESLYFSSFFILSDFMSYNKLAIRQFLYTRCISAYIAYMYSLLG